MTRSERKQKKLRKKQSRAERKTNREASVRNFLDSLISGERLKPDNLKKILKIVILTVGILFVVEVVMSIPYINGLFEQ